MLTLLKTDYTIGLIAFHNAVSVPFKILHSNGGLIVMDNLAMVLKSLCYLETLFYVFFVNLQSFLLLVSKHISDNHIPTSLFSSKYVWFLPALPLI